MEPGDQTALREAKWILENPSLAARLSNVVGTPIEKGFQRLPARFRSHVVRLTERALDRALRIALLSMDDNSRWHSSRLAHRLGVITTGGAGGFFGMAGLAVELPVSTTIMLRAIAAIAREHGEDTQRPEVRAACLQVFALGGPSRSDDGAETGFLAVRHAMAGAVDAATNFLARGGPVAGKGAPALVRLITRIAERFSIQVSEKAAAQALPIIGAAGGAAINGVFMAHFQAMAHGYFTVRRLEREYGAETVEAAYRSLPRRPISKP